jgi:hypothetical protein
MANDADLRGSLGYVSQAFAIRWRCIFACCMKKPQNIAAGDVARMAIERT